MGHYTPRQGPLLFSKRRRKERLNKRSGPHDLSSSGGMALVAPGLSPSLPPVSLKRGDRTTCHLPQCEPGGAAERIEKRCLEGGE